MSFKKIIGNMFDISFIHLLITGVQLCQNVHCPSTVPIGGRSVRTVVKNVQP
jgi:hypothetical protein